jgi:hypothetical protein
MAKRVSASRAYLVFSHVMMSGLAMVTVVAFAFAITLVAAAPVASRSASFPLEIGAGSLALAAGAVVVAHGALTALSVVRIGRALAVDSPRTCTTPAVLAFAVLATVTGGITVWLVRRDPVSFLVLDIEDATVMAAGFAAMVVVFGFVTYVGLARMG